MDQIPTYGMCAFVTSGNSVNELCIKSKEDPSEALFIRTFMPYANEYGKIGAPHKHDFYHIMLFLKGSGHYTLDFVKFDIKPDTAFCMTPGQVHSYDVADNVYFYLINFSKNYFRSFLRDSEYYDRFSFFSGNASDGVLSLTEDLRAKVIELLDNIMIEGRKQGEMSSDLIKVWMLEAFILMTGATSDKGPVHTLRKKSTLISKFKKLVDKHFITLGLPKDYASMLLVTPNYLNQMCKKELGETAGSIIRHRKLLEAKRLLVNRDLHISEVSNDLNFTDPPHFSKFFKKHTGISPEDFRKKYLNAA